NVVEMLSATHAKMDINLKGIHVGNSAQTTAAIGFNYQVLKGVRVGLDGNYYGRNYSYYNVSSIGSGVSSTTYAQPWMIPDAVTVDLNANYRFKIGEFDATLIGNIDNLLDSNYITDAVDGSDHTSKTAAVYYGFGRTWSTTLKIKF
ncbi:MAG TPA: TonB-dependent receptor, partial [Paludibacter sp.]|nr:TonB-dependent receptor [Paludibacter sp.]